MWRSSSAEWRLYEWFKNMKRLIQPPAKSFQMQPVKVIIPQKCCAAVWRIPLVFLRARDPLERSSAFLACELDRSRGRFARPDGQEFASIFDRHGKAQNPKNFCRVGMSR